MLRLLAVAVTIVGLVPVIAGNVGMVGVVATAVIAAPFWWLAFFQTVVDLEAEAVAIRYGGVISRFMSVRGPVRPDHRGARKPDQGLYRRVEFSVDLRDHRVPGRRSHSAHRH